MRLADIPIWQADPESKTLVPITSALLLYGLSLARTSLEQDDETESALDAAQHALISGSNQVNQMDTITFAYVMGQGVGGGTSSTVGTFQVRPLTWIQEDTTGLATLPGGGTFTLPHGFYSYDIAFAVGNNHSQIPMLIAINPDTFVPRWTHYGCAVFATTNRNATATLSGSFTHSADHHFVVGYKANAAVPNGLGFPLNIAGYTETYLRASFVRHYAL